jgi:hypothetical protein
LGSSQFCHTGEGEKEVMPGYEEEEGTVAVDGPPE